MDRRTDPHLKYMLTWLQHQPRIDQCGFTFTVPLVNARKQKPTVHHILFLFNDSCGSTLPKITLTPSPLIDGRGSIDTELFDVLIPRSELHETAKTSFRPVFREVLIDLEEVCFLTGQSFRSLQSVYAHRFQCHSIVSEELFSRK